MSEGLERMKNKGDGECRGEKERKQEIIVTQRLLKCLYTCTGSHIDNEPRSHLHPANEQIRAELFSKIKDTIFLNYFYLASPGFSRSMWDLVP